MITLHVMKAWGRAETLSLGDHRTVIAPEGVLARAHAVAYAVKRAEITTIANRKLTRTWKPT